MCMHMNEYFANVSKRGKKIKKFKRNKFILKN